jgi:hypothetical protein
VRAKVGITLDGSSLQVSIPTPPGAVNFTASFFAAAGTCATLIPPTAAGATTYTPYNMSQGTTSTVTGSTSVLSFSSSITATIPTGGKACVCLGASYGLDGATGYAQGAGVRSAYFPNDPIEVYQYGAFSGNATSASWSIVPNWLGRAMFTYRQHQPQLKFLYPGVGDMFTGFYPLYVLPNVGTNVTVNVTVQRLTDPLQDNFGSSTSTVKVTTYRGPGTAVPGLNYSDVSETLTWAPGDASNRTVSMTFYARDAYTGDVIANLILGSATGGCVKEGTSSTPLRIISRGCSGGPTCEGFGNCTVGTPSTGPTCVCNGGLTPNGGTCAPAASASPSAVPSGPPVPSATPFPSAVPKPKVEWAYREPSYVFVPNQTENATLVATSKQKYSDKDGTKATVVVSAEFFNARPVKFTTTVTRAATSKPLSITPALILEFTDGNQNGIIDKGEVVQVARIGLDGASYDGTVIPANVTWRVSAGRSSDQTAAGMINQWVGGLVSYDYGMYPSWSADNMGNYPSTQMGVELALREFKKRSGGSLAIVAVIDSEVPVAMKDVAPEIAASRGPVMQLVAGDEAIRLLGAYSSYQGVPSKVKAQYPMPVDNLDVRISRGLADLQLGNTTLLALAFEPQVASLENYKFGLGQDMTIGTYGPGEIGPNGRPVGGDDGDNAGGSSSTLSFSAIAAFLALLAAIIVQ